MSDGTTENQITVRNPIWIRITPLFLLMSGSIGGMSFIGFGIFLLILLDFSHPRIGTAYVVTGICYFILALHSTRHYWSYLYSYKFSDSGIDAFDPILRKHSSIRYEDAYLVGIITPQVTSAKFGRVDSHVIIARDGRMVWLTDKLHGWSEIRKKLAHVPFVGIYCGIWSAHKKPATDMCSASNRPMSEVDKTSCSVPNREARFIGFSLASIFLLFPLINWVLEGYLFGTDLLRSLVFAGAGMVMLGITHWGIRNSVLEISSAGMKTDLSRGKTAFEATWDNVDSVVLISHRLRFSRRVVTSAIVTNTEGKSYTITGNTKGIDDAIGMLYRFVPDRIRVI